ncbi:tripartite ATP-independent transporter solute receptor, DctP family [Amycolatopsis marina]|uniref:Tripartite ATP-independent transporter solute receptor, DctP family n=1 Tax=Amycolatopsis marina TaxID=490629 RepID=A0A1I1BZV3_9PSEU|nr:TRAP transporter substrate-binding protein [Amycolatopsis marina]SFB53823.1 tripartite ATP-independent transporter solute receptor, DctP family [Amycolatopsis marina]
MNSRLRRLYGVATATALTVTLVGCGDSGDDADGAKAEGDSQQENVSLTLGHVWPEKDPQAEATARFVEAVAEETDGSVEIEVFPAGQAGGDRDILEGLALGTTDIWVGGAGVYNAVSDVGEFFVTPFMFDSIDEAADAYSGELGEAVRQRLDEETETTVIGLWPRGPRHITTNKALNTPNDLSGLRIRVPENPMFIEGFEAMAANPTPMEFPEVFTALQQGTIDGQENPLALIQSSGFAQVQSHLNLTGHIIEPLALAISDSAWESLSERQQEGIRNASDQVSEEFRDEVKQQEKQLREELEGEGMTVVEPDINAFRKSTQPVRETQGSAFVDLYELVEQE